MYSAALFKYKIKGQDEFFRPSVNLFPLSVEFQKLTLFANEIMGEVLGHPFMILAMNVSSKSFRISKNKSVAYMHDSPLFTLELVNPFNFVAIINPELRIAQKWQSVFYWADHGIKNNKTLT